tara:strand:+ start:10694 stop:11080 length:387 start_codon:yes stop_codon:yes gene_type:complete
MIKTISQLFSIGVLNYFVIYQSNDIDIEQLYKDFESIGFSENLSNQTLHLFISFSVAVLTVILVYFFKPFTEMFLVHFLKINFYFLINLVSLSSIYIVYRIYGYSRMYLLIYLIVSSALLYFIDKAYR